MRIDRIDLLVVGGVFLLAACGTTKHWTKPGATAEDFNRDSYACAKETSRDTFRWRAPIVGGPKYGPEVDKDMYRACLRARGYERVEGGQWEGFRD